MEVATLQRRKSSFLIGSGESNLVADLIDILKTVPVFAKISKDDNFIAELCSLVHFRFYKDGDVIMREGEMAKAMFFVIKGVCTVGTDDFETIYAELTAPSFFGEMAAIIQIHRTVTVRASTRCILALLNSTDLENTFAEYPEVAKSMKEHVDARLSDMSKDMNRLGQSGTAVAKLSSENIEKYNEMRKDTSHGSINGFAIQNSFNNVGSRRSSQILLDTFDLDEIQDNRQSDSLASSFVEQGAGVDDEDDILSNDDEVGGISPLASMSSGGKYATNFMTATLMKHGGMLGPRRASVAVWADQNLMQMVQNNASPNTKEVLKPSRLATTSSSFTNDTLLLSTILDGEHAKGYGKLGSLIMRRILKLLSFTTLYKFRAISRQISMMISAEPDKYPCLTDIDLSGYNKKINDSVFSNIADFCGSALQRLSLKGCWSITDKGIQVISYRLPNLRVLSMASVWDSTDSALLSFSTRASSSTTISPESLLTHLDLSNCRKITDVGILSLLDSCHNLRSLELSYCKNLTAKMFNHANWPRFQKLNVQRCTAISDAAFLQWHVTATSKVLSTDDQILDEPSVAFQLIELNLSDCSFLTDTAILYISQTCVNLATLALSFCCGLSPAAISSLAKSCQALRSLDVSFCGLAVTNESLETISSNLVQLERLSVRGISSCYNIQVAYKCLMQGSHICVNLMD